MKSESPIWMRISDSIQEHSAHFTGLPFTRALAEESLPREAYLGMLQALSVVYAVLETELDGVEKGPLSTHWTPGLRLGPLLVADLKDLYPAPAGRPSQADDAALKITEDIRLRAIQEPLSLLGYLYAYQEPLICRLLPAKTIAGLFQLSPPKGLRYLSRSEEGGDGPWSRVKKALTGDVLSADDGTVIMEGAQEALKGLGEIFSALYPRSENPAILQAVGLNPEAGRHPVPEDPREVEAAIEGVNRCREAFPYYAARYGDRGKNFTTSDGAWLVSLTDHEQETVTQQVLWLAGLLAARGMPRVTMEVSLREIHAALVKAVPEKEAAFQKLLVACDALQASRCAPLEEGEQEALAKAFEERVAVEGAEPPLMGAGRLLISAVMDDMAGVTGTLENLRSWMTDPVRFSKEWIDAVDDTLQATRERSRPQAEAGQVEERG